MLVESIIYIIIHMQQRSVEISCGLPDVANISRMTSLWSGTLYWIYRSCSNFCDQLFAVALADLTHGRRVLLTRSTEAVTHS